MLGVELLALKLVFNDRGEFRAGLHFAANYRHRELN
jgi:hypothetical protein